MAFPTVRRIWYNLAYAIKCSLRTVTYGNVHLLLHVRSVLESRETDASKKIPLREEMCAINYRYDEQVHWEVE